MSWKVNTGIVMNNGWRFPQPGVQQEVTGHSYEDLLQQVLQVRLNNQIPAGNVKADVDEWICTSFPHQCHKFDAPPPAPDFVGERLVDKITVWLTRIYQMVQPRALVMQAEAERRAQICVGCPNNVDWRDGCPGCVENATRLSMLVRQGRETPVSGQLKACSALGHDNRAAVFQDIENIGNGALPEWCWARR